MQRLGSFVAQSFWMKGHFNQLGPLHSRWRFPDIPGPNRGRSQRVRKPPDLLPRKPQQHLVCQRGRPALLESRSGRSGRPHPLPGHRRHFGPMARRPHQERPIVQLVHLGHQPVAHGRLAAQGNALPTRAQGPQRLHILLPRLSSRTRRARSLSLCPPPNAT